MHTPGIHTPEGRYLRRYMRDLASLTALPAVWGTGDRNRIANDLAEVLLKILDLDFCYILLDGRPDRGAAEVARTRHSADDSSDSEVVRRRVREWLENNPSPGDMFALPHPVTGASVRAAAVPIGYAREFGVLVAAAAHPEFPAEEDQLIVTVAANQVAIVLQRQSAEESLRRGQRELTDFFDNAAVGLHWVGPDGTVLHVNQAELDLLGYDRDEYVGRNISEFHAEAEVGAAILRRLHAGETLRDVEARMRCNDGSIKDVLISSNVLWEDGRFVRSRCFTRDNTDRKRVQRRLATKDAVTRALAESNTLAEAAPQVLRAIAEQFEWTVGVIWYVDQPENVLRFADLWHGPAESVLQFETASRQLVFAAGVGLPGRVWSDMNAAWIPDVAQDENFPRAPAAAADGLRGAFAGPIVLRDRVFGVVEFFSRETRQPDPDFVKMMAVIGSQMGQFIERKRSEEALRQSESRFRQMAEMIPSIVWTAAPDGTITYANDRWYQFCGIAPTENPRNWPEIVLHPDDHDRCMRLWAESLRLGSEYAIEVRYRRHDGSYRWFVTRAVPFRDSYDRVVQWFGTTTDIDDSKRAEQTARFLAEASATFGELTDYQSTLHRVAGLAVPTFADWCAVDLVEPDGHTVRRLTVTHVEPAKALLAHELSRRYPVRLSDPTGIGRVIRTGTPYWAAEVPDTLLTEIARDEEQLGILRELGPKSTICVPMRSRTKAFGALTFAMAESGRTYRADDARAADDLAARAAMAIENANLLAALKETDRRKDEFLAMLAHELRNPLAPVRNALRMLQLMGPPDPDLQWAREVIERQVRQMTRLVDDLLDVSRITRGKIELRKERIELATVVQSAIEASRPFIDAGNHELTVALPPEPVLLNADPTRMTQVLLNLLNNSAKYMDPGGRIWLTARRDGDFVRIDVKDAGIGIAPEMLPRIFEIFTQVDRALDRSQGGLGIGLTLVQRLVELHGGTVEAHSEGPDRGSEFTLRLPIASADGQSPAESRSAGTGNTAGSRGHRRILVVDDNRDSANSMCRLLTKMGHTTFTAYDGLEAVERVATLHPDVVLLDIGLPKLNGYEVARRLRECPNGRETLLIAVTGWGQEEDRRRSKDAGFDEHLTKPVEYDALMRILAKP